MFETYEIAKVATRSLAPVLGQVERCDRDLARQMRRAGVTHNDIAKPQNWLMTPDGRAAVIDFQLATVHRRRGKLFPSLTSI